MSAPKHPTRNIIVQGHRTSLRLEREVFAALDEICQREGLTLALLCNRLLGQHGNEANLSSLLRVHAVTYFRTLAATLPWTAEPSRLPAQRRSRRYSSARASRPDQLPGMSGRA